MDGAHRPDRVQFVRSELRTSHPASIQFEHLLAAVGGVADQSLALEIDDEIEQFQGNLADETGQSSGKLGDIGRAISSLEPSAERCHKHLDGAGPRLVIAVREPNRAGDPIAGSLIRHREHRRPRVDQGIVDLDPIAA